MSLLPAWEKLPPLRRCYFRLLDPFGDTFDVWQNNLESTLEGLYDHHRVFRSNNEWQSFLDSQRAVASEWDLRHTLTDADRAFLAELKVAWEPETMRYALVRTSDGKLWRVPASNIANAKQRDPRLQVLHVDQSDPRVN